MTTRSLRSRRRPPLLVLLAVLVFLPVFNSHSRLIAAQKSAQKSKEKPYALIAGTVWGPDNRPVYGVPVRIRLSTDKPKKVRWEIYSDHHGEFAQRVPAGQADYVLSTDPKGIKLDDGKRLRLPQEVKVHVYNEEREDTGLHLTY